MNSVFHAQARRAGRTVQSPLKAFFMTSLGVVLLSSGAVVLHFSLPRAGIFTVLLGAAVLLFCIWWVTAGRISALTCPDCKIPGTIFQDEWAYFFRCSKCGRTADTGVPVGRRKW